MDIADPKLVDIMKDHHIIGVMHFAAHSQVGESMVNPAIYYENNVVGSYHLIESARTAGCKTFCVSSTAAVYGEPEVKTQFERMLNCNQRMYMVVLN